MSKAPPHEPSHHILERILREAQAFSADNRPFLACFDLDSTLFDLSLRVAAIVDVFALDPLMREKFPKECEILKNIKILSTDWGLGEPLSRIGITQESHPEFTHELHQHWVRGFFSNDFLQHDEPLAGAVEFVDALRKAGAHIMYLTGRDIPRMLTGTRQSLIERGFAVNDRDAILILKPDARMSDAPFKVDVLKEAEKDYERIWLFENEPVNLNLVARECPDIGLVFIDSVHSGREQVDETLARIVHFEVNLEEFRSLKT